MAHYWGCAELFREWTSAEAACRAVSLNDHRKLTVTRSGGDWIIDVPMRPGDGELILVEAP